jgi:hypothetical protein
MAAQRRVVATAVLLCLGGLGLGRLPAIVSEAGEAAQGLGYEPRVRSAASLLRRAEGWLESIDHESGAHVTLPGFTPGAPSLESRLALQ